MADLGTTIGSTGGAYLNSPIVVSDPGTARSSSDGLYSTNPIVRLGARVTSTHPNMRPAPEGSLIINRTTGGIRG